MTGPSATRQFFFELLVVRRRIVDGDVRLAADATRVHLYRSLQSTLGSLRHESSLRESSLPGSPFRESPRPQSLHRESALPETPPLAATEQEDVPAR